LNKYNEFIWLNGELIPTEMAKISVMSHVVHYGSSVFEGLRAYNYNDKTFIFRLEEHIDRLFYSAKVYGYTIRYSKEELCNATKDLIKANKLKSCYIRPCFFLGEGWDTLMPNENLKTYMSISAWFIPIANEAGRINLKVSSIQRISPNMLPMQAKAGANYMNSYLIRHEANMCGFDDGIALDNNGFISETSTANIFLVRGNKVITPSVDCSVLEGLTRDSVIVMAKNLGYEVVEKHITKDELYRAEEVFITGTAAEITGVDKVDHIKFGENLVTQSIFKEFKEALTKDSYESWKSYV
jgi:branched-chain amino acid aminotransferase